MLINDITKNSKIKDISDHRRYEILFIVKLPLRAEFLDVHMLSSFSSVLQATNYRILLKSYMNKSDFNVRVKPSCTSIIYFYQSAI